MNITVLSGKGGTGKTTVATNLALSATNVQFLDADVEEPNSYLFITADFNSEPEAVMRKVPVIDQSVCSSCRKCVEFCQYNALAMLGEEVLLYPEVCHSCGGCKHICPEGAIREQKRKTGQIKQDLTADLEFWQGELTIGEASAVPVIAQLKEHLKESKLSIIDAPAGNACPTIEAVLDTDYTILVTEPTPFGLHDLKLAVEMVSSLDKPHGIIINRSEAKADEIITDYATQEEIPILLRVPFSRQIAELYSQGTPFVKAMPDWKNKFQQVIEQIRAVVK